LFFISRRDSEFAGCLVGDSLSVLVMDSSHQKTNRRRTPRTTAVSMLFEGMESVCC